MNGWDLFFNAMGAVAFIGLVWGLVSLVRMKRSGRVGRPNPERWAEPIHKARVDEHEARLRAEEAEDRAVDELIAAGEEWEKLPDSVLDAADRGLKRVREEDSRRQR